MAVIERAEVFVTSPGRNFVTLGSPPTTGSPARRRDPQRSRARGRRLPTRSCRPLLIGTRPAPDRGHLAVPLPRRLLAARAGHHGRRSPRSTWRCGTSRARSAGMPVYQLLGGAAARRARLRPRIRRRPAVRCSTRSATHLEEGYRAIRVQTGGARARPVYGVADRPARAALRLRAGETRRRAHRGDLGHPRLPAPRAHRVRGGPRGVRPRDPAAARRPPPADADPGRDWASRWSRTTCSGSRTAPRPKTRKRCAWCASKPPPRWRSARSSTRSGTTRP